MELKEEMAYDYLFYDAQQILKQKWDRFLDLAEKYKAVLT